MRTTILVLFLIATGVCSASYQLSVGEPLTKDNDGHAIIDQMLSMEYPHSNIFISSYFVTHCAPLLEVLMVLELRYYRNIYVENDFAEAYPDQCIRHSMLLNKLQNIFDTQSFTDDDRFIMDNFSFFYRMKYLYEVLGALEQWAHPFMDKEMMDIPQQSREVVFLYRNAKALMNLYIQSYMKDHFKQ